LQETKKIAQTKLFIGFSDITSLGIFLQQKWNWKIIYGPMLNQLAFDKVTAQSKKSILDFIFGKKIELKYRLEVKNSAKKIEGEVVGGCLSVIASQFATSNQLDFENKILFLEDIDESGEKIDRYFCQFVQNMLRAKSYPSAILLGNYCFGMTIKKKQNVALAIKKLSERLQENKIDIAVFEEKTKCLGHAKNMMPLVIGARAIIVENSLVQSF